MGLRTRLEPNFGLWLCFHPLTQISSVADDKIVTPMEMHRLVARTRSTVAVGERQLHRPDGSAASLCQQFAWECTQIVRICFTSLRERNTSRTQEDATRTLFVPKKKTLRDKN
jgi:hypothetical protein